MKRLISMCFIVFWISITANCEDLTGMDASRLMQEGKTTEAIKAFEKLAVNGDAKAMVQLGLYHYEGTGVQQDYQRAMEWFLQAFRINNADAFVNLGVMHRDGQSVPKNKKIAYCVFLTTHMCGLGTESTQIRSNSCLRRIVNELSKDDIKDCLSNYTLGYMTAYIEAKGDMSGIPDKYKPSKENPALRDLGWWLDGELDGIYGEPNEEEKAIRRKKAEEREKEISALQHTLVFQIKFSKDTASKYTSYDVITDGGIGSGPISEKKIKNGEEFSVYENDSFIYVNQRRFITIENKEGMSLVYEIAHPAKPLPCDWSKWSKPNYVLKDGMDKFTLLSGGKPKSKAADLSKDAPELRFKVVKK